MDPMNLTNSTPEDKGNAKNEPRSDRGKNGKKQLQFKLKLNLWKLLSVSWQSSL